MATIQKKAEEGITEELALVHAAKGGDLEAFSQLVTRYDRNIFRIAQHITHNEEDAQDVVQDAFLKAYTNLAQFQDDEVLQPINGKVYTAGELRRLVEREPYQVLVMNGILAVLMGVLWLWARRAPLPAIACALALYLVVQVVSAILDPSSIMKGIVIKLIAFSVLYKGFTASLAARSAMQQQRPGV